MEVSLFSCQLGHSLSNSIRQKMVMVQDQQISLYYLQFNNRIPNNFSQLMDSKVELFNNFNQTTISKWITRIKIWEDLGCFKSSNSSCKDLEKRTNNCVFKRRFEKEILRMFCLKTITFLGNQKTQKMYLLVVLFKEMDKIMVIINCLKTIQHQH